MPDWESVVGLEIHVQLKTRTKMFCRCEVGFGAPPNSRTCPVCLAHPGALPVLNRKAVELGIKGALALNCRIRPQSRFARKNISAAPMSASCCSVKFGEGSCAPWPREGR